MVDTVTVLPTVHVNADRSQPTDRTSATTVHMGRATLGRFLPSTTADALLAAPGVDVSRTGPWATHVSLRGLSGERVLVLVDGVRLQSGRGHGAQTSLVSVDRLESVELMPGAGGAQFGSDALGGVVSLNTHRDLLGPHRSSLMLTARSGGPGAERSGMARVRWLAPKFGAELSGGAGEPGRVGDARWPRAQQQLPRGRVCRAHAGPARHLDAGPGAHAARRARRSAARVQRPCRLTRRVPAPVARCDPARVGAAGHEHAARLPGPRRGAAFPHRLRRDGRRQPVPARALRRHQDIARRRQHRHVVEQHSALAPARCAARLRRVPPRDHARAAHHRHQRRQQPPAR